MRTKAQVKGVSHVVSDNGIDAVRNLIFGEQIQEYEVRFSNLELKLSNKIEELDNKIGELNKALMSIEVQSESVNESKIDKHELSDAFRMLAQIVSEKTEA